MKSSFLASRRLRGTPGLSAGSESNGINAYALPFPSSLHTLSFETPASAGTSPDLKFSRLDKELLYLPKKAVTGSSPDVCGVMTCGHGPKGVSLDLHARGRNPEN